MGRDRREKQGIVHQLKEQQEAQEQAQPEAQDHLELPIEMIVHTSNVAIGQSDDGNIHFMILTPVGIKFTIPFPPDTWMEICQQSLNSEQFNRKPKSGIEIATRLPFDPQKSR